MLFCIQLKSIVLIWMCRHYQWRYDIGATSWVLRNRSQDRHIKSLGVQRAYPIMSLVVQRTYPIKSLVVQRTYPIKSLGELTTYPIKSLVVQRTYPIKSLGLLRTYPIKSLGVLMTYTNPDPHVTVCIILSTIVTTEDNLY